MIERKELSTFEIIIELKINNLWIVYENSELETDWILKGKNPHFQIRDYNNKKQIKIILNILNLRYTNKLAEKKKIKNLSCIYAFYLLYFKIFNQKLS